MTVSFFALTAIIAISAFCLGRAYEAAGENRRSVSGLAMPRLEPVDGYVAHFREYRAAFRDESMPVVYARWRALVGYHAPVAEYVAQFGVYDNAKTLPSGRVIASRAS